MHPVQPPGLVEKSLMRHQEHQEGRQAHQRTRRDMVRRHHVLTPHGVNSCTVFSARSQGIQVLHAGHLRRTFYIARQQWCL